MLNHFNIEVTAPFVRWPVVADRRGCAGAPRCGYDEDVPARLADLDAQGVDTQVVFSSLFLNIRCVRANAELALTRAYNRWIAQRCADSHGRLRWIFVPSLKNPQETVRDMDWAVRNGAVGVLFRGIEGDRFLDHPYFDPIYQKALELDWPICVHIGHGSPAMESIAQRDGARFNRFISDCPNYFAFATLLNSELPKKFPLLRFGFFESGCSWVSGVVQTALHVRLAPRALMALVREKLEEHHFYVTCELHEDLPHLLQYTGEGRLMLGSDYGHPGDIADTILFRQTPPTDVSDRSRKKARARTTIARVRDLHSRVAVPLHVAALRLRRQRHRSDPCRTTSNQGSVRA